MRHFTTSSPFSVIWNLFAFYARGTPRPDSILFCSIRACAKLLSQYLKSDHMTPAFISRLWRWVIFPRPGFASSSLSDMASQRTKRRQFVPGHLSPFWCELKANKLEHIIRVYWCLQKNIQDSKIIKQLSDVPGSASRKSSSEPSCLHVLSMSGLGPCVAIGSKMFSALNVNRIQSS